MSGRPLSDGSEICEKCGQTCRLHCAVGSLTHRSSRMFVAKVPPEEFLRIRHRKDWAVSHLQTRLFSLESLFVCVCVCVCEGRGHLLLQSWNCTLSPCTRAWISALFLPLAAFPALVHCLLTGVISSAQLSQRTPSST